MPELPEVETVRRGLQELIVGKEVRSAKELESPKSFPNSPADINEFLVGATVTDIRRRAKVLLIDLSSEYTLVVHLKMTGQLVFIGQNDSAARSETASRPFAVDPPSAAHGAADVSEVPQSYSGTSRQASFRGRSDGSEFPSEPSGGAGPSFDRERFGAGHPTDSLIGELPDRSTRVVIEFTDGSHLFFNDQRKFGWMKLFPSIEVPNIDFMKKVGPEPLEDDFTADVLWERLQRRKNTTIKAAILDQTVLAGVGNIYADEGLWGAKIHPATRVRDVPKEQIVELWREIREVMALAIEKGGSTDRNYVDAKGRRGSYLDFARAFRRDGQPCPRHPEVLIEKIRVAGRGTHICPVCQVEQV